MYKAVSSKSMVITFVVLNLASVVFGCVVIGIVGHPKLLKDRIDLVKTDHISTAVPLNDGVAKEAPIIVLKRSPGNTTPVFDDSGYFREGAVSGELLPVEGGKIGAVSNSEKTAAKPTVAIQMGASLIVDEVEPMDVVAAGGGSAETPSTGNDEYLQVDDILMPRLPLSAEDYEVTVEESEFQADGLPELPEEM